MKKIKILYISHAKTNINLDGATKGLFLIASSIDRSYFEPVFLTPGKGIISNLLHKRKIREIRLKSFCGIWPLSGKSFISDFVNSIESGISLMGILQREKPHIAHINCNVNFWGAFISKLIHIPVIWHNQELIGPDEINRSFCACVQKLAYKIIVPSNILKKRIIEGGVSHSKILVVPNFVEVNSLDRNQKKIVRKKIFQKWNIPENAFCVGFVGRLKKFKGIREFIELAVIINNVYPEVYFLIFGDFDPSDKILKEKIMSLVQDNKIQHRVKFLGTLSEIDQIYSCIDVLVAPFLRIDPYPMVLIEAMERGVPAISVGRGGPSKIIKDKETGILISKRDINAFARAVYDLIEQPEMRENISRRARNEAMERFNAKKRIKIYEKLYRELLHIAKK